MLAHILKWCRENSSLYSVYNFSPTLRLFKKKKELGERSAYGEAVHVLSYHVNGGYLDSPLQTHLWKIQHKFAHNGFMCTAGVGVLAL